MVVIYGTRKNDLYRIREHRQRQNKKQMVVLMCNERCEYLQFDEKREELLFEILEESFSICGEMAKDRKVAFSATCREKRELLNTILENIDETVEIFFYKKAGLVRDK